MLRIGERLNAELISTASPVTARAYEMARSGKYRSLRQIKLALGQEGFQLAVIRLYLGSKIRSELVEIMRQAATN